MPNEHKKKLSRSRNELFSDIRHGVDMICLIGKSTELDLKEKNRQINLYYNQFKKDMKLLGGRKYHE